MDAVNTHRAIDPRLCGEVVELTPGKAQVKLLTLEEMVADEMGLVHGGFVFGLADYAAMLAINEPTVVLGASETRFSKPVRRGEELLAEAEIERSDGRRHEVRVVVSGPDGAVLNGRFTCFVLDHHVLQGRDKT